jgi:hypothetical protein
MHAQYGEVCEHIRDQTNAAGAVVIVFRGKHGSGYAIRSDPMHSAIAPALPNILRDMADELDRELTENTQIVRKAVCR